MAASLPQRYPINEHDKSRRATVPADLRCRAKSIPAPARSTKNIALIHVPDGEAQAFRHLAHSIISRTLAHESEYHRMRRPKLDQRDWKLLKRHSDLSIYKRRVSKQQEQGHAKWPSVVCVGSIPGQLEDILYGLHAKTRDEMQVVLPFSKGYVDCALLAKLEEGSLADPYRQLALKWHRSDAFSEAKLMKDRDLCILESMGISTDAQGERYAYYLMQSVEYTGCPPPLETSDVIRANVMVCCIYRQLPGHHLVNVYAKGMFDLGGGIPNYLVYNTSSSLIFSVLSATDCAEAKRLTLLALKRAECSMYSSTDELSSFDLESVEDTSESTRSGVSDSTSTVSSGIAAMSPSISRLLFTGYWTTGQLKRRQLGATPCCVCSKRPVLASITGATHRTCGVCLRGVCSKCYVKRQLLAHQQSVPVVCCKSCLLKAKQLQVSPLDPCPTLSIEQ
uniref:FYVE-type domain-containing protein n=1 Tax=Hyaloperonospora arabidopsidis (strain Emoy2) TaxID=559515 RepID=M4BW90_HYAAE